MFDEDDYIARVEFEDNTILRNDGRYFSRIWVNWYEPKKKVTADFTVEEDDELEQYDLFGIPD